MQVSIYTRELSKNITINTKSGGQRNIRQQECYFVTGGIPHPRPFNIDLGEHGAPYPEGDYVINGMAIKQGQYGGLEIDADMKLIPLAEYKKNLAK